MTLKVVKKPASSSIAKDQKKEESKQEQDPKTSGMTTGLQSLCQNYESDESDWIMQVSFDLKARGLGALNPTMQLLVFQINVLP